jgi:DNA (cytosine-5)-methyltransferase 1
MAHEHQRQVRPDFEVEATPVCSADLFSGCGGLSLGVAQACFDLGSSLDIRLAVDFDAYASKVYATNFPKARIINDDIENIFDGNFGEPPTYREQKTRNEIGTLHLLVAGPPCQGHSDLNNYTRREDPKNLLYLRVIRAAEIVHPAVVFIENVPAVLHDRNHVVDISRIRLEELGYKVDSAVLRLDNLGIPQRRRRHVLLAVHQSVSAHPSEVLSLLSESARKVHDLRWAIGDLAEIESGTGIDNAPRASPANRERMEWMLANNEYDLPNARRPKCHQNENHSYRSMYGRLRWEMPAQTITSGFGSIGQGRYMHPDKPRALTPHEAARIQGFPDYFDFAPMPFRDSLARMIANAVPPQLARCTFTEILPKLWESNWLDHPDSAMRLI